MKPPVFAELDLADALARAKAENKFVVVDATADWCEPCKHMDRTTWVDPKVVAALRKSAVAVQIDVDAKKEDAARLKIKAMPTVIVFRDGVEIERMVGMQGADLLLEWIEGLARGESSQQRLRRESAEKPDDIELRMQLARRILELEDFEEATTEYVWLWKHMLEKDPKMLGVRLTFLTGAIRTLVKSHPPARAAFSELRKAVEPRLDALEGKALADWLALNKALGEDSASLAWYEANTAELLKTEGEVRDALMGMIVPMLIKARRWSDLGALQNDPLGELRKHLQVRDLLVKEADVVGGKVPAGMAEEMKTFANDGVARAMGILARSLRAAGRENDAKLVEDETRKHGIEPKLADDA